MSLDRKARSTNTYDYENIINEIEASGISTICRTINKFNKIMDADNVASKNTDLENLVKNDVELATKVLKAANSPLFRAANKQGIDNISNAIIMIGWDIIYKIGMSLTVKGLVKTARARTFANWMIIRAITIANISEVFLTSLKSCNNKLSKINSIYAYGLLHDIGAIGLLQIIEDYQQDVIDVKLTDDTKNWSDAEQDIYGFDHNMIGEHILLKSQLPRSFSIVARYHHAPDAAKYPAIESRKIALIRLAQVALVEKHRFTEHEALSNLGSVEGNGLIRTYDDISEDMHVEFEEQLGLTAKLYNEIKSTILTDDFVNKITQQFQN